MGERWDSVKFEFGYAVNAVTNWYNDGDNAGATWVIVVATAIVAFFLYFGVFFGGRAALFALSDQTMITIADGNPCLTNNGLIKAWAPAECYLDKKSRTLQASVSPSPAEQMLNNAKPADPIYRPPCGPKSDSVSCTDQVYSKRLVEGEIFTATFNGDEKQINEGHLQPDYTEVKFLALLDDEEAPNNEKFCGNVLDKFTPGKKFHMVISESKQSDYNGCYVIEPVEFTFGGDPYHVKPRR